MNPSIKTISVAASKLCVTIAQVALRLERLGFVKPGYYHSVTSQLTKPSPPPKQKGGDWRYAYVSQLGYQLPTCVLGSLDRHRITQVEASRILEAAPRNFKQVRQTLRERRAELADVG